MWVLSVRDQRTGDARTPFSLPVGHSMEVVGASSDLAATDMASGFAVSISMVASCLIWHPLPKS